ncbi:MAG: hypothetical protein Q4F88_02655 [Eubacteriales bacterium]|nr:hypothetical protein [Eubacteriales bacterium]
MVGKNEAYQNAMKNSDEQNARMECEKALRDVINSIMFDKIELFKLYQDNPDFKKWLLSMVFAATYSTHTSISKK